MASKKLDNLNNYEFIERISTDLSIGKYKIFGYYEHSYIDKFVLISVDDPEERYYLNRFDADGEILYENFVKLNIFKFLNSLQEYDIYSKEFNAKEINEPDSKVHINYEVDDDRTESIIFIEVTVNEKIYKYPIYTNIYSILFPDMYYPITGFNISNNNIIISSSKWCNYDYDDREDDNNECKNYNKNDKHYINKRVIDILETYFRCENGKIYCIYNNKKEIAELTLKTGDVILTEDGNTIIPQKLCLYIDNKYFSFYINDHNNINYKEKGEYYFLDMHVYSNSMFNNLIYGYDFVKGKYYYLKFEEKLILKNIDQKIAKKFKNNESQNLYTYLSYNNEKCGMIISIDEVNNITHKLVKLNDKCLKSHLDISLLKPINKWNDNPYEIDEFDSIVEGFGLKDDE